MEQNNTDVDDDASMDFDEELFSHKKTLESLKEKDPEFFEYLQKNDKELLEFDDDDIGDIENLLPEDNDEDDKNDKEDINLTIAKVNEWKIILQNPNSKANCLLAIKSIIKAFRKILMQTTDNSDKVESINIVNPKLFNLVINTSIVDLLPALNNYLDLNKNNPKEDEKEIVIVDPRQSAKWKRVMPAVKTYLTDVLKMMYALSANSRIIFERHILELILYYNTFPHLLKRVIRCFINEWYSGEERNRVLAFLILYRVIRYTQSNTHLKETEQQNLINYILRQLYMAYMVTSKNTNENTINQIVFMRNSLVELYNLDYTIAYQQAFIFMRQLTINLRKSVDTKEKNALKRVYNWQFVHSLNLWCQLVGSLLKNNDLFLHLLAPISNISYQALRLFSAYKYLPFRLHILDNIVKLSSETDHFAPVLRHILSNLEQIGKNRREIIASNRMRNKKQKQKLSNQGERVKQKMNKIAKTDLSVMLKISKDETFYNEFVEKTIDKLYELTLFHLKSISHFITFPEIAGTFCSQLPKCISNLTYPKGKIILKQLLKKSIENSRFINQHRNQKITSKERKNPDYIENFENEILNLKTPLLTFYEKWKLLKMKESSNDSDFNVGDYLDNVNDIEMKVDIETVASKLDFYSAKFN